MADWCTGVEVKEVANSLNYTVGPTERSLSVELRVLAANIAAFELAIGTTPCPFLSALKLNGYTISADDNSRFSVSGQLLTPHVYRVKLTYSAKNASGTARTVNVRPTIEMIPLPPGWFKWESGRAVREEEAQAYPMHGAEIAVTKHNLSSFAGDYLTLAGKCNDAPLTIAEIGLSADAETLIYMPTDSASTYNMDGTAQHSITAAFRYRPISWNKFLNGETGEWENIKLAATGADYKAIEPADLSPLI